MRKPFNKDAVLTAMADHVLSHGLSGASLRPLAKAAETSDRMLIYHFGSKDALLAEVLQALADRLAEALLAQMAQPRAASLQACADEIVALIRSDMVAPYMRVWLEIVSKSTHGDPAFRATGHAIIEGFFAWLTNRLPEGTPDPETTGRAMLTLIEGTLVLDAVGHHEAADRARAHLFPIED